MTYKDDYYEEVDRILDKMKSNPFEDQDLNSVRYEDVGQIQPVGWVENADASAGTPTVVINADGITVTEGAISVKNASGTTVLDDGGVKVVSNAGATVVINADGLTITGGDLTVTNPSGTVIIDGTSNMFKVAYSGNITTGAITTGNSTVVSATNGALFPSTTPACMTFVGTAIDNKAARSQGHFFGNSTGAMQGRFVALTSGGAVTTAALVSDMYGFTTNGVDGTGNSVVSLYGINNSGSNITFYCKFYVMIETAI